MRWFALTPESMGQFYASHSALVRAALVELGREGEPGVTQSERELIASLLQAR